MSRAAGPPPSTEQPPATERPQGEDDAGAPLGRLLMSLRTSPQGLSTREAARRLALEGPNELSRHVHRTWPRDLLRQFTHPLALLLMAASGLAALSGTPPLAIAIAAVVVLNAGVAFVQEQEAEKAVEALAAYLPDTARVMRDRVVKEIDARDLVPGDVVCLAEGDRICADGRLISGDVQVDLSTLTGESLPVSRSPETSPPATTLFDAQNLVFSGTSCVGGEARAVVTHTGMRTELGRIAALSQRVVTAVSPLERQVKRVAWLIAGVAVGAGIAFLPLGIAAGLSISAALTFSIGLLVANVPEGLLPTITLALAVGVRDLAKRGAVVKRLSAVETLGSTTVICTDKTGTLTQNQMRVTSVWTPEGSFDVRVPHTTDPGEVVRATVRCGAWCSRAVLDAAGVPSQGDPTEIAILLLARDLGEVEPLRGRDQMQMRVFHFDPRLKRMSSIDRMEGAPVLHVKGAPESVIPLCRHVATGGGPRPLSDDDRLRVEVEVAREAATGSRLLAVAYRPLSEDAIGGDRAVVESDLTLLGIVAMVDPPRPEVAAAIATAHRAGIRVHMVTGDHPLTANAIADRVGIGTAHRRVITGAELDRLADDELDAMLSEAGEIIFARTSPEVKLRIADALRALHETVAMTGDGVNDAPALRRADIGIAMGRSGTDVAREAATMVLTDDNLASVVAAIEGGRRVYDNVRRFIVYIFTHTVPEVVPFLMFAMSGGAIPLPLTVMQILAIDLGTDTLPALALSREPPEPGIMDRPPRPRRQGVIRGSMLVRSWGFMGVISAVLAMGGFLLVLHQAGWHLHDATGPGTPLHHAYMQATTVAWLGIVACQIGTAFAVRTERASLWAVGPLSNRLLLLGIAFELAFAFALVYAPPLHAVFGTASLSLHQLAVLLPFPLIVWGADELRRAWARRSTGPVPPPTPVRLDALGALPATAAQSGTSVPIAGGRRPAD